MSKRAAYVPKHRDLPSPAPVSVVPRRVLGKTLAFSALAVAATGVAVSGGVLGSSATLSAVSSAAASAVAGMPLTASTDEAWSVDQAAARGGSTSRSSDRRQGVDPLKAAALSQVAGPAVIHTQIISAGDPRAIARALLGQFGFSQDQFGCLDTLYTAESGWRVNADNPYSSAYGIPQALPGSKMATAGADWATNPETQIRWGLGYIADRYGTPCDALSFKNAHGWY